ncbi:MAG: lipoyl(octanoyl) transferase LipB [Tannerella sp.]|jgi:lipoyl(octanoyl) transferase|nr:lipoyl(octanoyl) transferase LipB [Tannerella sp.]
MKQAIEYSDWGTIDYKVAWDRQRALFDALLKWKTGINTPKQDDCVQQFIVCEHPHVYTLGKNGKSDNMLIGESFLQKISASYYHIERGGDITYHGPGQIVCYPVLDLETFHLSLREYIACIEETVIFTLAEYGVKAMRMKNATGVWLDAEGKNPRKIAAIGVRAGKYVTMHGFALNINTDLSYFSYIHPCGFTDKGVTSLAEELHKTMDMEEIKRKLYSSFCMYATDINRSTVHVFPRVK